MKLTQSYQVNGTVRAIGEPTKVGKKTRQIAHIAHTDDPNLTVEIVLWEHLVGTLVPGDEIDRTCRVGTNERGTHYLNVLG